VARPHPYAPDAPDAPSGLEEGETPVMVRFGRIALSRREPSLAVPGESVRCQLLAMRRGGMGPCE